VERIDITRWRSDTARDHTTGATCGFAIQRADVAMVAGSGGRRLRRVPWHSRTDHRSSVVR